MSRNRSTLEAGACDAHCHESHSMHARTYDKFYRLDPKARGVTASYKPSTNFIEPLSILLQAEQRGAAGEFQDHGSGDLVVPALFFRIPCYPDEPETQHEYGKRSRQAAH